MKKLTVLLLLACLTGIATAQHISIVTGKKASNREQYAKEYLEKKLTALGYEVTAKKGLRITLKCRNSGPTEGYTISRNNKGITIEGNDPSGVIYGAVELAERLKNGGATERIEESPQMVMRGTCIGLQKTVYLPGHAVYEYPYTPENFPWFYDKAEWVKYLDMLVENKMN